MTTVYSKFPPTVENAITWIPAWRKESRRRTLEHHRAQSQGKPTRTREEEIQDLVPLPWQAEDLIGTTWVNVWTGHINTVIAYEVPAPKWRPDEGKALIFDSPFNGDSFKDTLGFWMYDRYIIEHWLRYDHLTPQGKLEWMCLGISHIQDKINQTKTTIAGYHPDRTSCYAANMRYATESLSRLRVEKTKALDRTRRHADKHGLDVPMGLINAGVKEGGQLMLF